MQIDYIPWLGSLSAYELLAEVKKLADKPEVLARWNEENDAQAYSPLVTVDAGVATISVHGTLVSGSAGWMVRYGVVGYDDIRQALAQVVADQEVGSIIMDYDTGGGHVAGVHETAQLIARVDKVKPVVTYTGGNMMSAGVWLGVAGRKILASQTAEVGSIGILMVHKDYSKMMSDNGVKVTVIRAGVHKAVGNPYEPLSDAAKKSMEARAQAMYDIFLPWVADRRGVSTQVGDAKFGQGVTFLGQQGVDAGLVDKVGSYEDAFAMATSLGVKQAKKQEAAQVKRYNATNLAPSLTSASASAQAVGNNPATAKGNPSMSKQALSAEVLQTLAAAGVVLPEDDAEAGASASAENTNTADNAAAATGTQEKPNSAAPAAQAADVNVAALAAMQGLYAGALSDLTKARADLAEVTARADAADKAMLPFVAIARASVKAMGLTFGVTAAAADAMSADQVLAEHARLVPLFTEKYKGGGVAAAPSQVEKQKANANAVPLAFQVATSRASK